MADGRHLLFRFSAIISASINIFAPNLVQWWKIGSPKGSQCSKIRFLKIQDGGLPPSWISILGHNFGVDQHFCTKFCNEMENRQHKGFQLSKAGFSKIQDGGRPPSCISIFGHNFGVDQHFCTKLCIEMENGQPKGFQFSEIRFSKIQDGGRPPSWISILGHNFGVDRYFCTKFDIQVKQEGWLPPTKRASAAKIN